MLKEAAALDGAPLCPAGHLPHEGGDRPSPPDSPFTRTVEREPTLELLISPLVGEMAGRPEEVARERRVDK